MPVNRCSGWPIRRLRASPAMNLPGYWSGVPIAVLYQKPAPVQGWFAVARLCQSPLTLIGLTLPVLADKEMVVR